MTQIEQLFDLPHWIDFFTSAVPRVVSALVVVLIFWLLWRAVKKGIGLLAQRSNIDATLSTLLESAARIILVAIAMVTALAQLGIDVGGLLAGLGVAGLTIGFAAKDALSNLISGFFILWDRPFTIGDLIELGEFNGRVDSITLRTTRVVTGDGRMLAIPNTEMVNRTVVSYTNFPHLRIDIDFTVGTQEDLQVVRELALGLVKNDERFMASPAATVVVTALNDYNVGMCLRAWIFDERSHAERRFELREKLYAALIDAKIDMPLETVAISRQ